MQAALPKICCNETARVSRIRLDAANAGKIKANPEHAA
jgi:hypothetical protein